MPQAKFLHRLLEKLEGKVHQCTFTNKFLTIRLWWPILFLRHNKMYKFDNFQYWQPQKFEHYFNPSLIKAPFE